MFTSKLFLLLDFSEIVWPKAGFGCQRGQQRLTFNEAWPQGTVVEGPLGDAPCREEAVTSSCAWGDQSPSPGDGSVSCGLCPGLSLLERKLLGMELYLFQVSILRFFSPIVPGIQRKIIRTHVITK